MSLLERCDVVAFVATTYLARARQFYGHTLGLPMIEESPYACVFQAHQIILRVTLVDQVPQTRNTVLGWSVSDIRNAVMTLTASGVLFTRYDGMVQDEHGIWRSPGGSQVAWFRDLDGNTLSITQY